jgi:hypothetical protein
MKKLFFPIVAAAFLFSCSAPKYTYHFSTHTNYAQKDAAGKNEVSQALAETAVSIAEAEVSAPQNEQALIASVAESPLVVTPNPLSEKAKLLKEKYANADFSDREVMRDVKSDVKELKKDIKKYVKESKRDDSSKDSFSSLDKNLRLAIIFAIAAAITSIFLWQVGAVLWVVALVFLLLWVLEQ